MSEEENESEYVCRRDKEHVHVCARVSARERARERERERERARARKPERGTA